MRDYENILTHEEYEKIIEESLKKSHNKRFGVTITVNNHVYRLKNRAIAIGLGVSFLVGGLTNAGIDKLIEKAEENSFSGKYAAEFQKEVINENTHRTYDNKGFWYDYEAIADRISKSDSPDVLIYLCYLNIDSVYTGRVLKYLGYESFNDYMQKHNFEDEEDYSKQMTRLIHNSEDSKNKEDEVDKMLAEHSLSYDYEENSISLGGK